MILWSPQNKKPPHAPSPPLRLLRPVIPYALASVWMINGLLAKLLGLVPRHQAIVGRFVGENAAVSITPLIGLAEIAMALWILSGRRRRSCALIQAITIITMNSLEYWRARDLLLFPVLMPLGNALLISAAYWWGRDSFDV